MFSVTGHMPLLGRPATVGWADGDLSGDRLTCDVLRAYARGLEGQAVGLVEGPYTYRDHLADGLSTVFLIRGLFDEDATWRGDVPSRVAPPLND